VEKRRRRGEEKRRNEDGAELQADSFSEGRSVMSLFLL